MTGLITRIFDDVIQQILKVTFCLQIIDIKKFGKIYMTLELQNLWYILKAIQAEECFFSSIACQTSLAELNAANL